MKRSAWSLLGATVLWVAAAGPLHAEVLEPPSAAESSLEDKRGAALPLAASFSSHAGSSVRLGDVLGNGQPALLVLAYNRCEMLCSLVLRGLADLLREMAWDPAQFAVVTLSIDPRDTIHEAARMRAVLLERAGLDPAQRGWSFLVGSRSQIDAVASSVGFRYSWDPATEQYAHPAVLFVISASGTLVAPFQSIDPDRASLRAALLGNSSFTRRLEDAVIDCFRFDPASRRYGSLITFGLRGGGVALLLSVLGMMVWLRRREVLRQRQGSA